MNKQLTALPIILSAFLFSTSLFSQPSKVLTAKVNQVKTEIQPYMWGIFFEDINLGADGGIYAELVKNRSFEFTAPLMGWREMRRENATGSILVNNRMESDQASPRFIRVNLPTDQGSYGLSNEGFRGMGFKENNQYQFSIMARQNPGSNITLNIEILDNAGTKIGSASVKPSGSEWKRYEATLTASATAQKGRMVIWFKGQGSADLDMISLFPQNTWKQRKGGLREDLVQLLADMKPGFVRFPGGCIVEGRELATRYQWKKTIGDPDQRETIVNRWNTEFRHRPTPDYFQTFGLGFMEYFQLAEDIGATPLPILNCGMACQFNSGEVVAVEDLDPFVQDALDLIEFANGSAQTKWGKLRSDLGHPAPFNLKLLGIGNEQWGPQYIERYTVFAKAIKDKYPQVRLVSSVGPNPDGNVFTFLDDTLRKMNADILDEHYYRAPEWFLSNARRYDNYDRNGPKIFAGEYAAQSKAIASPDNKNNWKCALSEAAFLTGLERNADVVHMASYAPLFAHAEGWQWTPDLIWFDNLTSYGTPNYYVQKLFSNNKGTHVIPLLQDSEPVTGQDSCYASATIDKTTNEVILKIVNASSTPVQREVAIDGVKRLNGKATLTVLKGEELDDVNSFTAPQHIKPAEAPITVKGKKLTVPLPPYSLSVIRVKL